MLLTDIIERHAQQASFLWHLRDTAVRAPAYDLESLGRLDDRVDANLDGLRIAGDMGWEPCKAALATPGGGEVFTATVLAIERADVRALGEVLACGVRSPDLARGIVSGLGWVPLGRVKHFLNELLADDAPPELHYFGIAGSAVHRYDPGAPLADAMYARNPRLRARALRAIGELGRVALRPALRCELDTEDEACRFWAAWSAALLGDVAASEVLWRVAYGGGIFASRACSMAVRATEPAIARARIRDLAGEGKLRVALTGAAALGDPALVPWVIDCIATVDEARFAGWAFTMITGAALTEHKLSGQVPKGFSSGPSDDPDDPDVTPDPDGRLPWPEVDAVRAWWERNGTVIPPGQRVLLGRPIEQAWLWHVLRSGNQPAREAAAIEMGIRKVQPLFEVRSSAFRQKRILADSPRSG